MAALGWSSVKQDFLESQVQSRGHSLNLQEGQSSCSRCVPVVQEEVGFVSLGEKISFF